MKKRISAVFAALVLLALLLSGCSGTKMPFNGEVNFHGMQITIPDSFIRDSTQSTDNQWVFEHGGYQQYIVLMFHEEAADLEQYRDSMLANGCDSAIEEGCDGAVVSSWTEADGNFRQEKLLLRGGHTYVVMLHNGDEAAFKTLTLSIGMPAEEPHE